MKKFIKLLRTKDYRNPREYNDSELFSLVMLITNYGDSTESIKRYLDRDEGLNLGSMGYRIVHDYVEIYNLFDLEVEITVPLITFKFIIDTWQKIKALEPDSIIITEENGEYSISAEFNAPGQKEIEGIN